MKQRSSAGTPRAVRQARALDTPVQNTARAVVLAVALLLVWSASLISRTSGDHISAVVGEPSPRNIKAPRQLTYISEIKTREAQLAAAQRVKDIYVGPDAQVAIRQSLRLGDIISYITVTRLDPYTDEATKVALLGEIPGLSTGVAMMARIVQFDNGEWQAVSYECSRVLDLAMQEEIRDTQLAEARRQVRRPVALALNDAQRAVVVALTQDLVVPNTFFDERQTQAAREAARNAIEPARGTIREGESLLREGEIISDLSLEKLQVLDLVSTGRRWQDVVAAFLFPLVMVTTLSVYILRCDPLLLERPRRELVLTLALVAAALGARLIIPGHTLLPYLFPAAAVSMAVTILLDVQIGMVVAALVAVLAGLLGGGSLELMLYALLGSVIGSLIIWRMDHLGTFLNASVGVALMNMAVVVAYRLLSQSHDTVGLLQLLGMSVANALLSSSLTFVGFAFAGRVFGITTSLQLLELARPTHPLFRQLLIKAPGTYHHSIVISNMAESAAEAIGADALLARVGSYYHDIGKITRPYFFSENQSEGQNPHDKLDPRTSTEIIIGHTLDGLELARKHHLPDKVSQFIMEHHGTTLVSFFFRQASGNANGKQPQERDYRYPGPRPQTRETAIVMLADGIEAIVRAHRPTTQSETERMIHQIINDRLLDDQLDEAELTLRDLDRIRQAFNNVLQGIFHPRIQYPERGQRLGVLQAEGTPLPEEQTVAS